MCLVHGTTQRQEFSSSLILFLHKHSNKMDGSHLKCIYGLCLHNFFCAWCTSYASFSYVFTSGETDLLLHFLHLPDRTSSLGTIVVTVTQQSSADVVHLADMLFFLFFRVLQLALSTQTLTMVHMVCLHHLKTERKIKNCKNNNEFWNQVKDSAGSFYQQPSKQQSHYILLI